MASCSVWNIFYTAIFWCVCIRVLVNGERQCNCHNFVSEPPSYLVVVVGGGIFNKKGWKFKPHPTLSNSPMSVLGENMILPNCQVSKQHFKCVFWKVLNLYPSISLDNGYYALLQYYCGIFYSANLNCLGWDADVPFPQYNDLCWSTVCIAPSFDWTFFSPVGKLNTHRGCTDLIAFFVCSSTTMPPSYVQRIISFSL